MQAPVVSDMNRTYPSQNRKRAVSATPQNPTHHTQVLGSLCLLLTVPISLELGRETALQYCCCVATSMIGCSICILSGCQPTEIKKD